MKWLAITLKPLFVIVGLIVTGYMAVDAWVIGRAETVVKPLEARIMAVRSADIQHLDKRFDRLELLIKEQGK